MATDKEILDLLLDLSEVFHRLAKIVVNLEDRIEALEDQLRENHAPAKEGKNAKE